MNQATAARVTGILARITETQQVQQDLDLNLFDNGILDSFGMVELMVALGEEFGLEIAPTEVDRPLWATPRLIIDFVENKQSHVRA